MLNINSIIEYKDNKKIKVLDIIKNNRKDIIGLIKNGYEFDDEVLKLAHIKKTVKEAVFKNVFVEHETDDKIYHKDDVPLSKILSEINSANN